MDSRNIEQHAIGQTALYTQASPLHAIVNEDAAAVISCGPDALVLVVADGMGGGPAGEDASRLAVESMCELLTPPPADDDLRRLAIINGFELANKRVQELAAGAGTTLAALEIHDGHVRPYHVGDSFILIVGQRGKVRYQNIAHSPVGYAFEAGVIDEEEAMHHDDRAIVSNIVGSPEMALDVGPTISLSPRDTVIVASDGLSDNLWIHEIIDGIRKGPLEAACNQLQTLAQKRMSDPKEAEPSKPDDCSFVLYRRGTHRVK